MLVELPTRAALLGPVVVDALRIRLPVGGVSARLGFPSPAEDFQDDALDLNELCIRNPAATFLYRAQGSSMVLAGICDGDVLVVDRSVTPQNGDLVLACWDGETPICKILAGLPHRIELRSANPDFPAQFPPSEAEVELYAVVSVVRVMRRDGGRRVRSR